MKKILIYSLLAILSVGAFAQDDVLTSKKGIPVLPQAGDIAIGADALPYLEYIGNIFNNTDGNTLDLGSQNLYFRYYLDNSTAIKVNLSISKNKANNNYYVQDDAARAADPASMAMVEDRETMTNNSTSIMIGYQKTRGYGRLLGFYGAQVGYGYSRTKYEYQYGNAITAANQNPTDYWDFGGERPLYADFDVNALGSTSPDEIEGGIEHMVALGGFAGVEYYFLPKVCIGGEVSLMYTRTWSTQSDYTTEFFDGQSAAERKTQVSPGHSGSSLQTMRPATYSGLYLMFHF